MEMTPEDRRTRTETVGKITVRLTSYKMGDGFICTIDNVDPGAVIARASAPDREAAERAAFKQVQHALASRA